jgi:hypothetical protein
VHRRTSFSSGELRELSRFFLSSLVPLGLCHPSIVCAPDRAFLSHVPLHYSQGTYIFQLCKHTWSEKLSACVQVMAHFCQQAVPQCAQELCTRYFASVRVTSSHVMPRSPSTSSGCSRASMSTAGDSVWTSTSRGAPLRYVRYYMDGTFHFLLVTELSLGVPMDVHIVFQCHRCCRCQRCAWHGFHCANGTRPPCQVFCKNKRLHLVRTSSKQCSSSGSNPLCQWHQLAVC